MPLKSLVLRPSAAASSPGINVKNTDSQLFHTLQPTYSEQAFEKDVIHMQSKFYKVLT